jgi:hypothetical protein
LNDKAQTENQATGEADKFPRVKRDVKEVGRSREIRSIHAGKRFDRSRRVNSFISGAGTRSSALAVQPRKPR